MKTLILLCLFASVAWGQDRGVWLDDTTFVPYTLGPHGETVWTGDTVIIRPSPMRSDRALVRVKTHWTDTRDSLLSWWDQYKAECWKDSTKIDRKNENFRAQYPDLLWTEPKGNSIHLGMLDRDTVIDLGDGMRDCGFKTIVVPRYRMVRGRATFSGFMEFLRRAK